LAGHVAVDRAATGDAAPAGVAHRPRLFLFGEHQGRLKMSEHVTQARRPLPIPPRPPALTRPPGMIWLWTCDGASFGYRMGNELWSCSGRHCGRFVGHEIFAQTGAYRGELTEAGRLGTDLSKREMRGPAFTPSPGWVGTPARAAKPAVELPAGFQDFS
jgi:hypothetical protein